MAIDSTLFFADLPVGEYTAGQIIPMQVHTGPSIVRDGYGKARLKRIVTGLAIASSGAAVYGDVYIQNSNWIDPVINGPSSLASVVSLEPGSTCIQEGNDCELQVNSGWEVYMKVSQDVTTTGGNTVLALIDIDYPAVQAVVDPTKVSGTPASTTTNVFDTASSSAQFANQNWTIKNVDFLKAGYKYLLQKVGVYCGSVEGVGFLTISNAAGLGGLQRIIPITTGVTHLRSRIDYCSPLVKGPMDVGLITFNATAREYEVIFDWVKKTAN